MIICIYFVQPWAILCFFCVSFCIYIQDFFISETGFLAVPLALTYACFKQFKQALDIEFNICKRLNNDKKFFKYKFMHDNL